MWQLYLEKGISINLAVCTTTAISHDSFDSIGIATPLGDNEIA